MNRKSIAFAAALLIAGCASNSHSPQASKSQSVSTDDGFKHKFDVESDDWSSTGRNAYFSLEPGDVSVFEGSEDGKATRLVITVTDQTKMIDGVQTRVVEERESADGHLVEVSRNYFAIDNENKDIYYFGEDTDMYKNGKVVSTEGSWHSGENGAHYGMFMPAKPKVGQKFYQEYAPGNAMDRFEIVSTSSEMETPEGEFDDVVKCEETTPLEKGKEYKYYAPKVGLIKDGELKLVEHTPAK